MGKKKRGGKKTAESSPVLPSTPEAEHVDPMVLASVLASEFPLIDPSLVHALLLDYDPDTLGSHVDAIRDQLGILEATSVPDTNVVFPHGGSPDMKTTDASGRLSPSPFTSERSTLDNGTASTSSPSLCSDEDDPQTEAELLITFFPNLPKNCIDEALASEPSLDAAIDHLLSVELIRGVQRSGMWPDEPEGESEKEYTVVVKSRRGSSNSDSSKSSKPVRKPKKAATVTIPLVDTLQRRATPKSGTSSGTSTPRTSGVPSSDAWSAFASLAAYLSEVIPRAQPSFFTSYLHSPDYLHAHDSVLAALSNLATSARVDALPDDAIAIVEDIYGVSLNDEDSHQLELCLRATDGDVGAVMDLMDLLEELTWWPDYEASRAMERDPFETLANLEKALPSRVPLKSKATAVSQVETTRVISGNRLQRPKSEEPKKRERIVPGSKPPPAALEPPAAIAATVSGTYKSLNGLMPRAERWSKVPSPGDTPKGTIPWRTVATTRRRPTRASHPLAANIPAYARGMLPHDRRPGALAGLQDVTPASENSVAHCYAQSNAEWRRREEAIRAAGRHFKAGARKDTSAAVAGHYAAQARAATLSAREWELRGARVVIDAQLERTGHTVDLHYATVDQAVTLALETAQRWWATADAQRANAAPGTGPRPLVIVTGKGRHSAGQRGVLGPAVYKALADAGWRTERQEGYVVVKGRR